MSDANTYRIERFIDGDLQSIHVEDVPERRPTTGAQRQDQGNRVARDHLAHMLERDGLPVGTYQVEARCLSAGTTVIVRATITEELIDPFAGL